ncbi:hypothetical protein BKA70DRAFT_1422055 [Coprinopsis sp. MPI-PUGE-AT-0042]|nr:hypothetical protein BKA70DRAFT_1422055 [Coprinopsis sp. MPI-PUGE-AT-0042]
MPKYAQNMKESPSEVLCLESGVATRSSPRISHPSRQAGLMVLPPLPQRRLARARETETPIAIPQASEQALETTPYASDATSQDEVDSLRSLLDRTQKALGRQKVSARRAREKLAEANQQLEESREEVEELTGRLAALEKDVQQYRNWWLNEIQFTKLILNKIPNANEDWDLVRTSQSHYLGRF